MCLEPDLKHVMVCIQNFAVLNSVRKMVCLKFTGGKNLLFDGKKKLVVKPIA